MNDLRFPRALRIAAILALALALMPREGSAQRRRRDMDRDYRSGVDTTFAFDRRGTISLSINSGDIVVTGSSRDEVHVRATSESDNIRLDVGSSRTSLEISNSYGNHGETHLEISVPTGVKVIARAQSGDIAVRGTRGQVDVRSQSGDIKIQDVADRIDIGSLSGDIEASGLTGDVQIKSVSGEIHVSDLKGDFGAETTSGS